MKKTFIILAALIVLLFASCASGITPQQAANGKAKCGRYIR